MTFTREVFCDVLWRPGGEWGLIGFSLENFQPIKPFVQQENKQNVILLIIFRMASIKNPSSPYY